MKKVSGACRTATSFSRRGPSIMNAGVGLLLLLTFLLPLPDHNTLRAEKKKIILEHSNTIEGGQNEKGAYQSVTGKVVFWHDTMNLRCDRATSYDRENRIVLAGNILISNRTFEIFSDNGVYYPDTEIGELNGNVRAQVLGRSLFGRSQEAVINTVANRIWLNGGAIVWYGHRQISGDIILLHLRESAKKKGGMVIDKIQVEGNAFFASEDSRTPASLTYDQLGGKTMSILVDEDSNVKGITVSGQAEGLYHLYDEKHRSGGINYSSGNEIRMFFRNGEAVRVRVSGNVEGKHYPQSYLGDPSINLPKFTWRENENPFRMQKSPR